MMKRLSPERRFGGVAPIVIAASLFIALGGACAKVADDGRAGPVADQAAARNTVYRVPIDGAPSAGDARAPVTLVAFSDYECPFCGRADALVGQLQKAYGSKLRVVMRQHPLPSHAHARAAALAAIAADAQGKFWPMHERLFASSRSLDDESLVRLAGEAGLDVARWGTDRAGAAASLARDEAVATTLGVTGTPTFFVNGRKITGAQSIDLFKLTIDEEIAKAETMVARGVRPADVYATLMKDAVAETPAPVKLAAAPAAAPGALGPRAMVAAETAPPKPACDAPDGDCGCTAHDDEALEPGRVEDVRVGSAPVRGPDNAPVTIVVFSDFECPFCQRSEATLRALVDQYGGKVRVAFRNHALPMHPNARDAAKAALAAGEQGKFWEYHDVLFAHQDALDGASLERYAKDLGLDVARFRRVMASSQIDSALTADEGEAVRLGVMGTPTTFVNGRRLIGAQPLAKFQATVELGLADGRR